jgi:hypothetical protein
LSLDLSFLSGLKRYGDIEKAIKAYLRYRPKAEAWMYDTLAVIIEINKGPESEAKTALGWAGYLAKKEANIDTMIRVGDLMLMRKIYEVNVRDKNGEVAVTPGDLFDEANAKAPHRPEPLLLSLQLAKASNDPKRMADTVEKLLSLAWPGFDEAWRIEATKATKDLAKILREDGKDKEADELLRRLAEASSRDIFIRLNWVGDAGIELVVEEPLGVKATYTHPRTVGGGAIVKNVYGTKNAECIYSCPRAFDGDYTVTIDVIYNDEKKPVTQAILEIITHEGTSEEQVEKKLISLSKKAPIKVALKGGRRKQVLPFQSTPTKPAQPAAPAAARGNAPVR